MERRKRGLVNVSTHRVAITLVALAAMTTGGQAMAADGDTEGWGLDPSKVMGSRTCLNCHPSETLALIASGHNRTHLLLRSPNARKYAAALELEKPAGESRECIQCHATPKTSFTGDVQVISGVSCESCHGAAGGEDGWLNAHAVYGPNGTTFETETAEHRVERLKRIDEAGMVRTNHVSQLASNCFGCHSVRNAALVNAGHKSGAGFELVGRSTGSVRHNFHEDQSMNSEGPTLWARRDGGDVAGRRRIKFLVGVLADAATAFEALSAIEDEEVLESDYPEELLGRAEPPLEYLEVSMEALEDDLPEQIETAFELIEEGLDAEFTEAEGREALAEAAAELSEIAEWFASQDGKNLEPLDDVLEEFVEPKGTPYQRQ